MNLLESASERLNATQVSQRNEGRANRGPDSELVAAGIVQADGRLVEPHRRLDVYQEAEISLVEPMKEY